MAIDPYSQYDVDDFEEVERSDPNKISVVKSSITTQLTIGDQTVTVINPEYVERLQKRIGTLEKNVSMLIGEIRKIRASSRARDSELGQKSVGSDSNYD